MKKMLSLALVGAFALTLAACGGNGGGNVSTGGGTYYTHNELAYSFVNAVNNYIGADDLEIVKVSTEQYDYIVVYDHYYGTYDAYYLGGYNPGENIAWYLEDYDSYFYYDLDYLGDIDNDGHVEYEDYWTGTRFEKVESSSTDIVLMAALEEELQTQKISKALQGNFGMSADRAQTWAEALHFVKSAPEGSVTPEMVDNMSLELIGTTYSSIQKDIEAGDLNSLDSKIAKAGQLNDNMLPSQINKILSEVFVKN